MIKDLLITPLDIIETPGGNVMHAMKNDSPGYFGFGEAYFSEIEYKMIKAWKRHREMTLNLVVPHGEVRFILYDDRHVERIKFQEIIISKNNYFRLTIPPLIWLGFQGLSKNNSIVLNIANIHHSPDEADNKNTDEIEFDWGV